jgi:NAD(P)-dependent dehydrogenase (short-subunit alcohol dehydrogenase family)
LLGNIFAGDVETTFP